MTVKGSGNTKLELDGKNVLDSRDIPSAAGLYKDDGDGWLTITDKTDDGGKEITSAKKDGSGSLTAQTNSGYGGAAIGGVWGEDTKNIIIEGYATVNASAGGSSAGIGGGGSASESGDAENIIIRGHSKVTATAWGARPLAAAEGRIISLVGLQRASRSMAMPPSKPSTMAAVPPSALPQTVTMTARQR